MNYDKEDRDAEDRDADDHDEEDDDEESLDEEIPIDYCMGGYHEVLLNDQLKEDESGKFRYTIRQKLGFGSNSTVWLAWDESEKKHVAIKIIKADRSVDSEAAKIIKENAGGNAVEKKVVYEHHIFECLKTISSAKCDRYITQLLDVFEHNGPNGVHSCLVFEPMAATVREVEKTLDKVKSNFLHPISKDQLGVRLENRLPFWMARRILKQCLEGLAFLHENNMAHGDLHAGSLMFVLSNTNAIPPPHTEAKDSQLGHYLPSKPLTAYADTTPEFRIKLSDLDSVYSLDGPPPLHPPFKTKSRLRSPESILPGAWGERPPLEVHKEHDMWAFGCLIFEIITGRGLFPYAYHGDTERQNDYHLMTFQQYLGPLPDNLLSKWSNASDCHPAKLYDPEYIKYKDDKLEHALAKYAPPDIRCEYIQILNVIRGILQYNPDKRPKAQDVLKGEWFKDIDSGSAEAESREDGS